SIRPESDAVSQTVFLKAFERFDEIGGSPSVPGWLKTVTTHLCLNHLSRYRARWQIFSALDRDKNGSVLFADTIPAPEAVREESDARRLARLESALQALPAHQRVPIAMFHFDGRSYEEIATLLGVSLGKVKTDIHRGRLALKNELDVMD